MGRVGTAYFVMIGRCEELILTRKWILMSTSKTTAFPCENRTENVTNDRIHFSANAETDAVYKKLVNLLLQDICSLGGLSMVGAKASEKEPESLQRCDFFHQLRVKRVVKWNGWKFQEEHRPPTERGAPFHYEKYIISWSGLRKTHFYEFREHFLPFFWNIKTLGS